MERAEVLQGVFEMKCETVTIVFFTPYCAVVERVILRHNRAYE
jgi:hypothetical protein